ncbi:L-lactate permease [Pendulispora albinea]|uniref:L-lactate permease n=1 Tax=Pendulispora albinea TaxID=2741071 RepID=A0ABZ2M2X8_9BACT
MQSVSPSLALAWSGPPLTAPYMALASLPIVVLLTLIMGCRWSAPKAGAAACLVTTALACAGFGESARGLAISSTKGLSLSLFVLSVIWSAVLLYNIVEGLGGIRIIGRTMGRLVGDPLAQALVVGWAFAGFMQGVAGFGVPVAVVAPLLVLMGFGAAQAAAIVLIGHAWSVTFGSLGSSYYTIQLVTGIHGDVIAPRMAALFALPIVASGFAVAHVQGGLAALRRGTWAILLMGGAMALAMWLTARFGMPQLASVIPGLVGCCIGWLASRLGLFGRGSKRAPDPTGTRVLEIGGGSQTAAAPAERSFHLAFLPYYVLIGLSLLSQWPALRAIKAGWGLDYPGLRTGLGFSVEPQKRYAAIELLRHPAPLILFGILLSYAIYRLSDRWKPRLFTGALRTTYAQCISTSVGICTMVMMAVIMTDTGMTALLGRAIAAGAGSAFAVFSPYIGVLGTFMTGSNTNSNVMFGALQLESARALAIDTVAVASVQSIGGALGSAIAPTKVLVGTAVVGLSGREGEVMKRTIPYCMALALLVGVQIAILLKL